MVRPKQEKIFEGEVMIDHTFCGGKEKNKSKYRRWLSHQESGGKRVDVKIPVFGMVQRDGEATMIVVPDPGADTAMPIIFKLIDRKSTIVSDGGTVFSTLSEDYNKHVIVNHSARQYVNGEYTTNHIESIFALLKRTVYGTYHNVTPKHLQRYCEETIYRYNTRKFKDPQRFMHTLQHSKGRLKYNRLIAKFNNLAE